MTESSEEREDMRSVTEAGYDVPACALMPTRSCPRPYDISGCEPDICARLDSNDETPWRDA